MAPPPSTAVDTVNYAVICRGNNVAHNLFQDKMGFVGEPAWHGLGCRVEPGVAAQDMLRAANLDWRVEKGPPPGVTPGDEQGRYMIWREPVGDETHRVGLAFVGAVYEPLQNAQAFEFFDRFVDQNWADFHTAGALGNGERVWVLARLKDQIVVGPDDEIDRFLLLSNSHDGSEPVTVRLTPIRVVCQNTLNLAFREHKAVAFARHTRNVRTKLQTIAEEQLQAMVDDAFHEARKLFAAMARHRIGESDFERYLEAVLGRTENQRDQRREPERWLNVREILEDRSLTPAASAGTLWALYNAVIAFEDYRTPQNEIETTRLRRVWFEAGTTTKIRAFQEARVLMDAA